MIKNFLITCLLFMVSLGAYSQNVTLAIKGGDGEMDFFLSSRNVDKATAIDNSYLTLTYKLSSKSSPHDPEAIYEDVMVLQIGKGVTRYYNSELEHRDSVNTKRMNKGLPESRMATSIAYEIFTDVSSREMTVVQRVPLSDDSYEYKDVFAGQWRISVDTDSIMGYVCQKAETEFRGRSYTAWFAPEIPVTQGPWKFHGLPGAILKVYDEKKDYSLECIGLTQEARPILKYANKTRSVSRDEWRKFESHFYQHAGQLLQTGLKIKLIDEKGASRELPESWSALYNPQELE